jgi:glycosyltransferase involved in cell wall biosynthesis
MLGFMVQLALQWILAGSHRPQWIIARSTDGLLCALLCKLLRSPTRVLLHNHGWEEKVYALEKTLPRSVLSSPTTWKAHCLRFPLLRATLACSGGCISGTLAEVRWLCKRYPRHSHKMFYLPNGVSNIDIQQNWQQSDPSHYLAVGTLTWKKNLDYVVKVFDHIARHDPRAHLWLVGTGSGSLRLAPQLSERVSIVPTVKPHAMVEYYRNCSTMLCAARYEGGHSLALLEAMAQGMVVCATPIDSTREFIRHGHNGILIEGREPQADAQLIRDFLTNAPLKQTLQTNARATAARNSWQRQGQRLERILL